MKIRTIIRSADTHCDEKDQFNLLCLSHFLSAVCCEVVLLFKAEKRDDPVFVLILCLSVDEDFYINNLKTQVWMNVIFTHQLCFQILPAYCKPSVIESSSHVFTSQSLNICCCCCL